MNEFNLIHGDCIEEMNKLVKDGVKVDMILTDPPYGTIKGLKLDGWENTSTEWDEKLPTKEMFELCEKILKMNSVLILFSQEPYTSYLRQYNPYNLPFVYPLYWLKDHFANSLSCKKAPVSYIEDLTVYRKKYDTDYIHPLREYAQKILKDLGITYKDIEKDLGHRRAEHFFYRTGSSQFSLCTEKTYNELIDFYHINKFDYFKKYDELKKIDKDFKEFKFNLHGKKFKPNVLKYKKSYNHFHPTEKPVKLLKNLIKTYTNEGDTVLDFTMGSGSTGVASIETGRNFIGIEINKKYYNIAKERIEELV